MGKLYRVEVRFDGLIYAEDETHAEEIAEYEMIDGESPTETLVEDFNGTLPPGWSMTTIPWGSPNKTLEVLLKEQDEKEEVPEEQGKLFSEEEGSC
jgi:hypothetical protein